MSVSPPATGRVRSHSAAADSTCQAACACSSESGRHNGRPVRPGDVERQPGGEQRRPRGRPAGPGGVAGPRSGPPGRFRWTSAPSAPAAVAACAAPLVRGWAATPARAPTAATCGRRTGVVPRACVDVGQRDEPGHRQQRRVVEPAADAAARARGRRRCRPRPPPATSPRPRRRRAGPAPAVGAGPRRGRRRPRRRRRGSTRCWPAGSRGPVGSARSRTWPAPAVAVRTSAIAAVPTRDVEGQRRHRRPPLEDLGELAAAVDTCPPRPPVAHQRPGTARRTARATNPSTGIDTNTNRLGQNPCRVP